ncbi:hypothetical protein [Nocardia sp. NRRL S-836]|nr:hypothetical protein [Nocardia sp. NRRL S-836]
MRALRTTADYRTRSTSVGPAATAFSPSLRERASLRHTAGVIA